MARSIDPAPKAVRGFVPARTDEERYLMRHIEDLARTAESRGIPRYSGFLSDREQDLAKAALNRAEVPEADYHFEGGWPGAERKLLCIEPEGSWTDSPLCCVRLDCRALPGATLPTHRDYLGSLMGLELKREALGDIVLPPDAPGTAYVFALEPVAKLICQELCQVGRTDLSTTPMEPDALPAFPQAERTLQTATVSSLRLDAVCSTGFRMARGKAVDMISSGHVQVNWRPCTKADKLLTEGDTVSARGFGKFQLAVVGGVTKKGRTAIVVKRYI